MGNELSSEHKLRPRPMINSCASGLSDSRDCSGSTATMKKQKSTTNATAVLDSLNAVAALRIFHALYAAHHRSSSMTAISTPSHATKPRLAEHVATIYPSVLPVPASTRGVYMSRAD